MTEEQDALTKQLQDEFGDKIKEVSDRGDYRLEFLVDSDSIVDIATYVKHDLGFTIPNMCTGIDQKDQMDVVWHINTPDSPIIIVLRVELERDNPEIPALTNVWEGMNWHERETYDLLGVNFVNHPDLRRLLMPENWEGHPLREDYVYKKPTYRKPEDFE